MTQVWRKMWTQDDGILSFEWVLLITLLTIGIVSGLAAARDAVIDELGDVAQSMLALDQSFVIDYPLDVQVGGGSGSCSSDSGFLDHMQFTDEGRSDFQGQESSFDTDS